MLQSMHDRAQSWLVWAIVAGLSFVFALFGMSYYLTPSMTDTLVKARVNGEPITLRVYQQNVDAQVSALGLDQASDEIKNKVVQQLVQRTLLAQIAQENGFVTSPTQIEESIIQMPLFEDEGSFSQARFDLILKRLGLSTSELKRDIGSDITAMQFQKGILSTQIIPTYTLDSYIQMALQTRDIGYAFIPFDSFDSDSISDELLQEYYHQHQSELLSADQLELEYVLLDQNDLTQKDQVLSTEERQKLFHEQAEMMAELAFENPDSLQPIVQSLHLTPQVSSKLYQDASKNTGVFQSPVVMSSVFSEAVLGHDNSGLIPVSDTQLMVLRQKTFYPSHLLTFDESKDMVRAQLMLNSKKRNAQQFLEQLLQKTALNQKEEVLSDLSQKQLSWVSYDALSRSDPTIPSSVMSAVWAMPEDAILQWTTAPHEQGLFLVQLIGVAAPHSDQVKKDRAHFESGLKALQTQIFLLTILKQKLKHADIQIYP